VTVNLSDVNAWSECGYEIRIRRLNMNKRMIVLIALVAAVFAVPASAEDMTSNGASGSVSVTSIAIRAEDGMTAVLLVLVQT
jgi:hypothetical protein